MTQTVQTVDDTAGSIWESGGIRVKEAIAFSGLSRSELYARIARNEIPTTKVGRARIIAKKALVELLRSGAK
jgi:hypothetical protein